MLLPLASGLIYSLAAIAIKRSLASGASHWQVSLVSNLVMALLYQPLWFFSTNSGPWYWLEPCICGALFLAGQSLTFIALSKGDVSLATPVLGAKVLMVAALSAWLPGVVFKWTWGVAAILSVIAIALIAGGKSQASWQRRLVTVVAALLAALSYGAADLLIQIWAPRMGVAAFIPTMFAFLGVATLVVLPVFLKRNWLPSGREARFSLGLGSVLLALQALSMALALGVYGEATVVNVIYNTRVVWSVLFAWWLAKSAWGRDEPMGSGALGRRLLGAGLIFAAIVLTLF